MVLTENETNRSLGRLSLAKMDHLVHQDSLRNLMYHVGIAVDVVYSYFNLIGKLTLCCHNRLLSASSLAHIVHMLPYHGIGMDC